MAWLFLILGGLLIGLTLGLTGSGGSILTVPVLVYLVGHPDKVAIAESMLIVGAIAIATVIPYAKAGETDWILVLGFGLPGILGTLLGKFASDQIDGSLLLIIFGGIVLGSAAWMLRGKTGDVAPDDQTAPETLQSATKKEASRIIFATIGQGVGVGFMTGLIGVGGGFLIVPALVLFAKLPMRRAVGTSLAIISINSTSGFLFQFPRLQQALATPNSTFTLNQLIATTLIFVSIGIAGSFWGRKLSSNINQAKLRRGFAVFLLFMGSLILLIELQNLSAISF